MHHPLRQRHGAAEPARAKGGTGAVLRGRTEAPNFHDRLALSTSQHDGFLLFEDDAPYCLGWGAELPDECAALEIPDLDAAVGAAGDDARVVELQGCDAVVVGCEAVDGRVGRHGPDADGAVAAACDEGVAAELELADEGGVALENAEALAGGVVSGDWWQGIWEEGSLPVCGVPDAHARVETAGRDALAVKGDGVNLTEVPLESAETAALADAPYPSGGVVAAAYYQVAVYLETSDTTLVSYKNVFAVTSFDVPNAQSSVA